MKNDKLHVPKCCGQKHPGLCQTRDAAIYHKVLEIEGALVRMFNEEGYAGGSFVILQFCYREQIVERVVYVGYERGGSEKAIVLYRCSMVSDNLSIVLRESGEDEVVMFTHLVKDALTFHPGPHKVRVCGLKTKPLGTSAVRFKVTGNHRWRLAWEPCAKKQPQKPPLDKEAEAIEKGIQNLFARAKTKSNTKSHCGSDAQESTAAPPSDQAAASSLEATSSGSSSSSDSESTDAGKDEVCWAEMADLNRRKAKRPFPKGIVVLQCGNAC